MVIVTGGWCLSSFSSSRMGVGMGRFSDWILKYGLAWLDEGSTRPIAVVVQWWNDASCQMTSVIGDFALVCWQEPSTRACLLDCSAIVLHRLDKDALAYLLAMIMPGKEVCRNGRCRFNLKIQETYYVVTKATLGKDKSTLPYSVNLVEVYSGMGQSEKGFYSEKRKMWNDCFVYDSE